MFFSDERNLFNFLESKLDFSTQGIGRENSEASGEFIDFEGRKIWLKKKPKSRSFRISISLPKKSTKIDLPNTPNPTNAIKIVLSHPTKAKPKDIMDFCQKNKEWIAKTCAKYEKELANSRTLIDSHNGEVLLFGEWIGIQNLSQILKSMQEADFAKSQAQNPPKAPKNLKTSKQILSFILLDYIATRTQEIAQEMGLEYGKIGVRETTTRFGSCTENRLSFSLLLACAQKTQIDYVIIHELAHIVHKNHSSRFWNLVERHCPCWRDLRKSLQQNYSLFRLVLQRLD